MSAESYPQKSPRIEIEQDGHIAYLSYEIEDGWMILLHTKVPDALGGRGIGGKLVVQAYDYAKEHSLQVQLVCPFAVSYVAKHPELQPFTGVKPGIKSGIMG
jgi:hypothetical protein